MKKLVLKTLAAGVLTVGVMGVGLAAAPLNVQHSNGSSHQVVPSAKTGNTIHGVSTAPAGSGTLVMGSGSNNAVNCSINIAKGAVSGSSEGSSGGDGPIGEGGMSGSGQGNVSDTSMTLTNDSAECNKAWNAVLGLLPEKSSK